MLLQQASWSRVKHDNNQTPIAYNRRGQRFVIVELGPPSGSDALADFPSISRGCSISPCDLPAFSSRVGVG